MRMRGPFAFIPFCVPFNMQCYSVLIKMSDENRAIQLCARLDLFGFVWICYRSIEKRTLHCSENANVWLEIKFMCCWFFSLSFYSFLIVRHERRMGARVNEWVNRIEWVSNSMLLLLLLILLLLLRCWRWWCFSYNGCFQLENCFILLHTDTDTYTCIEHCECELCVLFHSQATID